MARPVALEWWERKIRECPTSGQARTAELKRCVLCVLGKLAVFTKAKLGG